MLTHETAEYERQRAENERQRAESEKDKSDSYGALRYRLIAQLRALGVEPEA